MNVNLLATSYCLFLMAQSNALTLDQALDQAIGNDKKYASAIFDARSASYLPTIGRAGLLPKLVLTGFRANNNLTQTQADIFGNTAMAQQRYTSQSYAAQLTQPLVNLAAIASYLQSVTQEKAAQQKLSIEFNDLRVKVIDAYCAMASAQEVYADTSKELEILVEQEKILMARQLAGVASKIDVEEATYARLQTQSSLDEASSGLIQAKISLEKLVGNVIARSEALLMPQISLSSSANLKQLLATAKDTNPKILYQKENVESAIYENKKNKAAYMPTLDIVAYQGYQNSNSLSTVGQKSMQGYGGLQLNIPLSTGGEIYGKEHQSAFNVESQRMLLESEMNDVEESVKKMYFQAQISTEKLSTLRLQIESANRLYISFFRQREMGLKSTFELLAVIRKKFQSERELSKSAYERIQALKKLEVAVGGF